MQLMLWYLENEGLEESGPYYKAIILLEKEKEQIKLAFREGKDYCGEITSIEYYNQTYSQNK